jgi:hypothetical protein
MMQPQTLKGYVARLITDDELAINLGSADGVREGMSFNVLDTSTESIPDPVTGEDLGSIERLKARIRIISVSERLSLGVISPPRGREGVPSSLRLWEGPRPRSGRLTGDAWPEGVKVGDPVQSVTSRDASG